MIRGLQKLLFHSVLLLLITAGSALGQAQFIPNQGQWRGDFAYRADLSNGALFFQDQGFTVLLREPAEESGHHHGHKKNHQRVAYRMRFEDASSAASVFTPSEEQNFYTNYFYGKNPANWKSRVPVYLSLKHEEVYAGIDIEYYSRDGHLKYDLLIDKDVDASVVKMKYEGLQDLELREGKLVLHTGLGEVTEYIPEAYQIINGNKVQVKVSYTIQGSTVGFQVEGRNLRFPLIIDPILTFSTFTGSTANNWGYTATYDTDGAFYGGGVTLASGYPVSLGVVQDTFGGGESDVAISKFNASGDQLLFSTYIGGSEVEVPQSMVVDNQGNLIVLGSTGSDNFPTTANSFQENFTTGQKIVGKSFDYDSGANIYVLKMNSSGTNILASTLLGGNIGDGVNTRIFENYGDNARGEVITLDNNNIAITTSAQSTDLPLGAINVNVNDSVQNAVVAVFSPNLQSLVWGNYFGGDGMETGYSIRSDGSFLYMSGATNSNNLPTSQNAVQPNLGGQIDGYLAKFNISNGNLVACTYLGTPLKDQAFMIALDRKGDLYTYGQSEGAMPITPGKYNNQPSNQFVQKYTNDLSNLIWSTQVGSGKAKSDLVPTAFMVDHCLNIYLSGWNGGSNTIGSPPSQQGNTFDLPVSSDAFQTTTDGSDFYFMILDRNATGLLFGSFFGGTSEEHVDGGTSRFSPEGIIYQAACAACYQGDFPTTPGAYSPTKPNRNCNLGAIKIDFESTVRAEPEIDFSTDVDTLCNQVQVKFTNSSFRANKYYWDFGNGQTSTQIEPTTIFPNFGTYTITLIAEDTLCGLKDTATITFEHTKGFRPQANFDVEYTGCDHTYEARFNNTSDGNNTYYWDFGDGATAAVENPVHNYNAEGSYQVMMIVKDILCQSTDTAYRTVTFKDTVSAPEVQVYHPKCNHGILEVETTNHRNRFSYEWTYGNKSAEGINAQLRLDDAGTYNVLLTITDSLCSSEYEYNFQVKIQEVNRETFIANAFSPNEDGINDEYIVTGDECGEHDLLRIYNRWGAIVFETTRPYEEFWDGTFKGREVPTGVYIYILKTAESTEKGHLTLFR